MKELINPAEWEPLDNFILEEKALEVIKNYKNSCVIAGPGAGKTELLAQKASYLLQTGQCNAPRKILALSYKKDAERNIKERVSKRVNKDLGFRFISMTYDAFAKRILDNFYLALPSEYQPNPNYEIGSILEIFSSLFKGTITQVQRTELFIKFTKEIKSLPFNADFNEFITGTKVTERIIWEAMFAGSAESKISRLTFPAITILAEYVVRSNPLLLKSIRLTYSHIFLDEFQDTAKANYSLLKTCFLESDCSMTAVGDDKQRIMLWAGAYNEIFTDFEKNFKSKRITLLMNYRSAPRLVLLQRLLTVKMGKVDFEISSKSSWGKDDGECEIYNFKNSTDEAKTISEKIAYFIKTEKLLSRDICFIVRQRPIDYSKVLIEHLNSVGIEARDENEYQDLLSEEITLILIDLFLISIKVGVPDSYIRSVEFLNNIWGGRSSINDEEKQKEIEIRLTSLRMDIQKKLILVKSEKTLYDFFLEVIYDLSMSSLQLIFPQYRKTDYLETKISNLSKLLWKEYELTNDWGSAILRLNGENSIPLMTIHKSKGLEYDTIIFIGLEDNAFWNFRNQVDEETSNFFVALSRAKKRVIFTFTRNRNSRQNSQSGISDLYDVLRGSGIVNEYDFT